MRLLDDALEARAHEVEILAPHRYAAGALRPLHVHQASVLVGDRAGRAAASRARRVRDRAVRHRELAAASRG
jgi:hypothetical protein